jgi:hypothetical protein
VTCAACKGKGWVLWVWPNRKPLPALWFTRGPRGERPTVCDTCDTISDGETE